MNPQIQRARANDLRKSGQLEEAAKEYAAMWPDGDVWTGWGYASCLRKLGRTSEAIEVAREVHRIAPEFRFGRHVYAWSLYDQIRLAEHPESESVQAAEMIVRLMEGDEHPYEKTSPFVPTVLRMAKAWAAKRRDLRALEWLGKLDPAKLQTEEFCRTGNDGRTQRLASPRERYYGIRTHALERLGRWEECVSTATIALGDCGTLHHDNEIWFARRVARAKVMLGRVDEALAELQELAARKPSSFIETDIAAAAWKIHDVERTWTHALGAVVAHGDVRFKLHAIRLLAEVLWHRGEVDNAKAHLRLCAAVRRAQLWNEDKDLTTLANEWGADVSDGDADGLLRDLRSLWKSWHDDLSPRRNGAISRMLPHGHAGFIRSGDGNQFYFETRDWKERKVKATEGAQVTFATRPGFDRRRKRATTVACDVRAAL
jgi:tetratricopeptide (TPR) repeat protein